MNRYGLLHDRYLEEVSVVLSYYFSQNQVTQIVKKNSDLNKFNSH